MASFQPNQLSRINTELQLKQSGRPGSDNKDNKSNCCGSTGNKRPLFESINKVLLMLKASDLCHVDR